MITVGQVKREVRDRITKHPAFRSYPKVKRRLNCGWHLFHNGHSIKFVEFGWLWGEHGWRTCLRCGRISQTYNDMLIDGSYQEENIGYLHEPNPGEFIEEILKDLKFEREEIEGKGRKQ